MRVTELFGKTLRDDPADAELVSHKLMIKAGMIYQVGAGLYAYLPLAWRSLRKIEQIIREEMDAAGGQEIRLSIVQPQEIWDESGRTEAYGPDLFRLKDRRERPLVLAPTHEELLTNMVKANVHSYRDLPLLLYQIHTKFRDEPRPRGGLIRVREFDMKDAYSFDADEEGLDKNYQKMVQAYKNIYSRCGLDVIMVDADSGAIGGKDSNEFILLTDAGEDTIILCPKCGYAANAEKALFTKPPAEAADELPLEELETPGIKTIEALAEHLGVSASQTLKAVFYMADGELVFVVIRGDLDVNEVKLRNTLGGVAELRLATPEEVAAQGIVAGSASPVGLNGVKIVADDSIELGSNFVVGANKPDRHLRNANHGRDFKADVVADIALAREGYACPSCGDPFETSRGIEVGHVFKLGTRYSDILGALYPDQEGNQHSVVMGCYGIGLGRLLAAAVEQHNDDKGMILPEPIAPYDVSLLALNIENEEVVKVAEELYEGLQKERVEVLFDDRADSAGVKFNDADLLGLPLRLVVSPRNLKQGVVEIKRRSEQDAVTVPVADVVKTVKGMLST
ncbi:MAG: proline--tRNA ligase [Chloroflexi bacterium]|nr:proline--tRNA ligase [Chloroflexota bacterium]